MPGEFLNRPRRRATHRQVRAERVTEDVHPVVQQRRLEGDSTIPLNAGYTGIIGDPAQHGWTFRQDNSGNVDAWSQSTFKYPVTL